MWNIGVKLYHNPNAELHSCHRRLDIVDGRCRIGEGGRRTIDNVDGHQHQLICIQRGAYFIQLK